MNYWKIAFFALLILSMTVIVLLLYNSLDQGITLTYQKDGYLKTEEDLDLLVNLFNELEVKKEMVESIILESESCTMDEQNKLIYCGRIGFEVDTTGVIKVIYSW